MINKYFSKFLIAIVMIVISFILIIFSKKNLTSYDAYTATDFYFDTFVSITITDKDIPYTKKVEIVKDIFTMCKQYELTFSSTLEESELYKINESTDKHFNISKDLYDIISDSIDVYTLTNGSFDIKLGKICSLWNFKQAHIPDNSLISSELNNVNLSVITLNDNLTSTNVSDNYTIDIDYTNGKPSINLGGIAKGYIADKIKEYLIKQEVQHAIINLGGNILLVGDKNISDSNDTYYNIGITLPFTQSGETIAYVKAIDTSIVTSGIYERYFVENDTIYHHIIDPSTGYPVQNNLYSVTIIADSSTLADALSTSLFVLGLEDGLNLINSLDNVYAVFVTDKNELILSNGLEINEKEIKIIKK